MSDEIIKEILTKQKELVIKSEKAGYVKALSDLLSEMQIRELDGFLPSSELLSEVVQMLLEKHK